MTDDLIKKLRAYDDAWTELGQILKPVAGEDLLTAARRATSDRVGLVNEFPQRGLQVRIQPPVSEQEGLIIVAMGDHSSESAMYFTVDEAAHLIELLRTAKRQLMVLQLEREGQP